MVGAVVRTSSEGKRAITGEMTCLVESSACLQSCSNEFHLLSPTTRKPHMYVEKWVWVLLGPNNGDGVLTPRVLVACLRLLGDAEGKDGGSSVNLY